jgi:peptidoglycan hydrolase CwlO-like protein
MGFDFAKRRAELQAAMDLNALQQAELQNDMSALLKEFRQLELQEHEARAKVRREIRKPTGIMT